MPELKTCEFCGVDLVKPHSTQRFCSIRCGASYRTQHGWATHNCLRCGTEFRRPKNRKATYCSKRCTLGVMHDRNRKKPIVTAHCVACGVEFQTNTGKKFCSFVCSAVTSASQMGRENKTLRKTCPCVTCGVPVEVARNVPEGKVHCEEHRAFYKTPKPRNCALCGKQFMAIRPTGYWCSKKCASLVSAKQRALQTKEAQCRECGTLVVVPRATDHNRVMCPEHRKLAKRAVNAKVAAAVYARKCSDFSTRLSFLISKYGPEDTAVTSFISQHTTYSRPLRKLAEDALRAHAEKIEINRRTWENVKQIKELTAVIAGTSAKRPYDFFNVTGLSFDPEKGTWVLSLRHQRADKEDPDKQVLLAQYLVEAKMGRFLRAEEELTWVSGIKRDCSFENLRVVTKVTPIEYRGFWSTKDQQREAS